MPSVIASDDENGSLDLDASMQDFDEPIGTDEGEVSMGIELSTATEGNEDPEGFDEPPDVV